MGCGVTEIFLADLSPVGLLCPRDFLRDTAGKLYGCHVSLERGQTLTLLETILRQDRKICKWEARKSV